MEVELCRLIEKIIRSPFSLIVALRIATELFLLRPQFLLVCLLQLFFHLQLEPHDLLSGLLNQRLPFLTDSLTSLFPSNARLEAKVHIDSHRAAVFCLKAKPVHDVRLTLLINVPSPDDFLKLLDTDATTKKEAVDFVMQRASWAPCFNAELVVARLERESDEAISFNAVTAPAVYRVHLEQQEWSLSWVRVGLWLTDVVILSLLAKN